MTHCYNCGHAGTFVLLVEFALAVSAPVSDRATPEDHVRDWPAASGRRTRLPEENPRRHRERSRPRRERRNFTGRTARTADAGAGDEFSTSFGLPTEGDLSFAVQCPRCDSTDVGVSATELLARYESNTTS